MGRLMVESPERVSTSVVHVAGTAQVCFWHLGSMRDDGTKPRSSSGNDAVSSFVRHRCLFRASRPFVHSLVLSVRNQRVAKYWLPSGIAAKTITTCPRQKSESRHEYKRWL